MGHVADVLGQPPPVAEGIGDLRVALTGEPVGRGPGEFGASCNCLGDERVDVVGRQIEDRRRRAGRLRGTRSVLRELVGEDDLRPAEVHFEIDEATVGERDPMVLPGAEYGAIPIGGRSGVMNDDVDGDHRAGPYGEPRGDGLYVLARVGAVIEDVDEVTVWRTAGQERLIWMEGRTTGYRVDPVGEYVIGLATCVGYRLRRAGSWDTVAPNQLVVLDPSSAHSGAPIATEPWAGRLLVIELPDVAAGSSDVAVEFPDPVVGDPAIANRFNQLHETARSVASRLERESSVAAFLHDLAQLSPNRHTASDKRLDLPAVRAAARYLQDNLTVNVSLDDVARAAGTSKFHLVRQFRAVTGVPPHTFQVGQRIRLARRLLESGFGAAEAAAVAGFVDQSHLHRHFTHRLGITPGRYARSFARR